MTLTYHDQADKIILLLDKFSTDFDTTSKKIKNQHLKTVTGKIIYFCNYMTANCPLIQVGINCC